MSELRTFESHLDANTLGRVGHSDGQLVLHFERLVSPTLEDAWRTFTASSDREHWIPCAIVHDLREGVAVVQPSCWSDSLAPVRNECRFTGVTCVWQAPAVFEWTTDRDTVRWELATVRSRTYVACVALIDSVDIIRAAIAGAGYHVCFEQFVGFVETGSVSRPPCGRYVKLTSRYVDSFAAVLADAD